MQHWRFRLCNGGTVRFLWGLRLFLRIVWMNVSQSLGFECGQTRFCFLKTKDVAEGWIGGLSPSFARLGTRHVRLTVDWFFGYLTMLFNWLESNVANRLNILWKEALVYFVSNSFWREWVKPRLSLNRFWGMIWTWESEMWSSADQQGAALIVRLEHSPEGAVCS